MSEDVEKLREEVKRLQGDLRTLKAIVARLTKREQ